MPRNVIRSRTIALAILAFGAFGDGCQKFSSPRDPETNTAEGNTVDPVEGPAIDPIDDNFNRGDGAGPRIGSGDAVFFVGNSFMGGEDDRLSHLVANLAAVQDPPMAIQTGEHVVYGNNPLSWFFQQPESQAAIESGEYDVFVIQGEEREPVDDTEGFKQAVRDYHSAVTARGGTIMLFMTWDFIWEADTSFFETLALAYEELGQELGVPVIPVGLIYDDCNEHPYGDEQPYWLTNQALHQNHEGTAVNTYATFAMLTGINPEGKSFVSEWAIPPSEDLLRYLSDASWARVEPRLY